MDDLLRLAVDGHGGWPRWQRISRFRAAASITGAIWTLKGRPGLLDGVVLDGHTRDQHPTITPFPGPGRRASWQPDRQTIETAEGVLVAERRDPAAAFIEASCQSPWDELQVAYFASEATWNYAVAPFLFARGDFVIEETWPWREDGKVWRTLLVTYPESLVAHSRQQTCYFDDAGLLRRLDYTMDILGGGPTVHYPSQYRVFDGIAVPTRRRGYIRRPDGSPLLESVSVAVDVSDVTFPMNPRMEGGPAVRSDIVPGGVSPDCALPDHTGTVRTLSELQGADPLILTLARGHFCPKEHQQHLDRAAIRRHLDIQEYTDPDNDLMIPHTLVLRPGPLVHSVYGGLWFWDRPSVDDLWLDLCAATRECRPDRDLSTPGLREAWAAGDWSPFHGWDRRSGAQLAATDAASRR